MEPIHFLARQQLPKKPECKAELSRIDAFYDEHGHDAFVALSRWRKRVWLALNPARKDRSGTASLRCLRG